MDNYRPQFVAEHDFARIEAFVKELVADTANPDLKDPIGHVHAVAAFVHWAHNLHGYPLERGGLLNPPMILAFTEGALKGESDGYVATVRSRLMGVALKANPAANIAMPPKKRRPVNNPPYADSDLDRFVSTARGLGSPYRRRSCLLTIALSAGAGLNPSDYVRLRNRHIFAANESRNGIVVDVPDGAGASRTSLRARKVVVLPRWEPIVHEFISKPDLDPDAFVVWERVISTRENLSALTSGLKRAIRNDNQRPVVSRLRTTWMVHHLRLGTPIAVLTNAAGLTSAEAMFRYMPYVDLPDWETQKLFLRGGASTPPSAIGEPADERPEPK